MQLRPIHIPLDTSDLGCSVARIEPSTARSNASQTLTFDLAHSTRFCRYQHIIVPLALLRRRARSAPQPFASDTRVVSFPSVFGTTPYPEPFASSFSLAVAGRCRFRTGSLTLRGMARIHLHAGVAGRAHPLPLCSPTHGAAACSATGSRYLGRRSTRERLSPFAQSSSHLKSTPPPTLLRAWICPISSTCSPMSLHRPRLRRQVVLPRPHQCRRPSSLFPDSCLDSSPTHEKS
ncbi:hypothetical protein C8R46DRAFT_475810 [Mycena filopes]|nr:hypothetical protein C8R46DRAFT_475810 [Mycena filopes]